MSRKCKIEGCERTGKITRGMCRHHYRKWLVHARPGVDFTPNSAVHGFANTQKDPTYQAWRVIHRKCYQETSNQYASFGAKGIRVAYRWNGAKGFLNFREDMGTRPPGKYLDRVDPNEDFTPENCVWRTMFEVKWYRRDDTTNIYRKDQKYTTRLSLKGKPEYVGTFDTLEEAIAARDKRGEEIIREIQSRP